MSLNEKHNIRIAILDMNEGQLNQGMRCLREIVHNWCEANGFNLHLEEFEVRKKLEVPGINFDIYLSSGGPGSPLDSVNSEWERKYFAWLGAVEQWNIDSQNYPKKNVFFICHSFQLACRHYNLGKVSERKSTSFGVFPIHLQPEGSEEVVFDGLKNPFYAVDSRDYQVTEVNEQALTEMGATVLAIEKERPHIPYERAVMAVRFNEYFIGTQFHPEADAMGMSMHLQKEEKKKIVIDNHGETKWRSMIEQLNDPDKILYTYHHIIPNFLNQAVGNLVGA